MGTTLRRRSVAAGIVGCAGSATFPHASLAAYPDRRILLVVPDPPGGAADATARLMSEALSVELGQAVVVENRAGAGSVVGTNHVVHAPADGYTVLLSSVGLATAPALYPGLPFDPLKDLRPVVTFASGAYVMVVKSGGPLTSVRDVIEVARANPGKLRYGSAGVGSTLHLAGALFAQAAGIDISHIPYRGAGPALLDLLGGAIELMFGAEAEVMAQIKGGMLRGLGVTSLRRSKFAPDIPPIAETLPGFEVRGWYGLAVAAGCSDEIVSALNRQALRALASPELAHTLDREGFEPIGDTPAQAGAWLKSETERWSAVMRDDKIDRR